MSPGGIESPQLAIGHYNPGNFVGLQKAYHLGAWIFLRINRVPLVVFGVQGATPGIGQTESQGLIITI